ncbi:MAG: phage capsid protein [Pseudomonadota bacterium]
MSTQINKWFIEEFQTDVHAAYQQQGARLRHTVRTKNNVRGEKTHFNTAGIVGVGDKARGGNVPIITGGRGRVECTLISKYGGDYVEDIDELKTNIDEKQVIAMSFAWAHGRHTDNLIIEAITQDTNTHRVNDANIATGLKSAHVQEALEKLNQADVPDDGARTALVTPHAWEELLAIDAFAKADYIGKESLPWLGGSEAKRWRNCLWMMHTGLPINTENKVASCVIFHKTAVGHAIGKELEAQWSWENTKSAWFLNTRMLQGACLIDPKGVVKIHVKNNQPISTS